jgi:hypothetical protein
MTEREELARLQKDAGIPDLPTQLTYECRMAMSRKGPRAYDWEDKPQRLIYDLCREIERLSRPSPVDGVVAASRILIRGIWQGAFGHWHITGGDPESVVTNLQNAVAAYDKAKGETQ